MPMSTSYELAGRTRQKQRTRIALVAAARDLVAEGVTPTVEATAERAAISRTTAHRHLANPRRPPLEAHPHIPAGPPRPPGRAAPPLRLTTPPDRGGQLTAADPYTPQGGAPRLLLATANRAGSPCDATGSRLPA